MAVMVVHNETDRIYFQIKTLREGLGHVKPARTLKSCCLWDFTDKIFDENNHVLVIVSKQCQSFRKVVLRSFHNYKERCSTRMCRVCVVFETESCVIEEDFESLIGKENVSVVDDLRKSVKWLPKVCAFLFETTGRNMSLNCVIPNVGNESKIRTFRSDILDSLRDMNISVSKEFKTPTPRCSILFKQKSTTTTLTKMSQILDQKSNE